MMEVEGWHWHEWATLSLGSIHSRAFCLQWNRQSIYRLIRWRTQKKLEIRKDNEYMLNAIYVHISITLYIMLYWQISAKLIQHYKRKSVIIIWSEHTTIPPFTSTYILPLHFLMMGEAKTKTKSKELLCEFETY